MADRPSTAPQDPGNAQWRPGFELPTIVTKHKSVVLTPGLQPEDQGVLDFLRLRDPRLPATQELLQKEMQAIGWKMGKGRFASCFQRLKAAGHIKHHCPFNEELGRPEWVIEFYMDPANNDQYVNRGVSALAQVSDGFPVSGDPGVEQSFGFPETGETRGQEGFPVSGNPGADSRFPGIRSATVSAGQGRIPGNPVSVSPPPHPPEEEVGTTSPSPHKHAAAPRRGKQQAPEVGAAALEEAIKFLMGLPGAWALGLTRARGIAPWLVENAHLTGWKLNLELRMYLTRPQEGSEPPRNHGAILAYRVKNMQMRDAVLEAAAEAEQEQQQKPEAPAKKSGMPVWCGECNDGEQPREPYMRTVEQDGDVLNCPRCHPAAVRARQNV
ncbi:hypothetical protein ACVW0K_007416 [Streptomyces filamentosus]